jgi:hypothetical protein
MSRIPLSAATIALTLTAGGLLSACGSEAPETVQYPTAAPGAARLADRRDEPASPPTQSEREPAPTRESTGLPTYDGTLVAMVESAIAAEPELNTLGIDVTAAEGTIFLRGQARTRETRRLATEVASTVDGVKHVQNELLIAARQDSEARRMGEL